MSFLLKLLHSNEKEKGNQKSPSESLSNQQKYHPLLGHRVVSTSGWKTYQLSPLKSSPYPFNDDNYFSCRN